MNKVYSKSDLFSYSHTQSVSPISTSLPKTEIKFSIDNASGEYNPHNQDGMAKYFMERQEVKTRYGLKLNDGTIEWIKGGTFYLSEWYAKQNGLTAEFTARDLLEFMSAIYDESHDLSPRTLYNLAEKVLRAAELPSNDDGSPKWVIDEYLKSITTKAPLPKDTLANCLQVIANAGECVLYQDRDGILHIERLESNTSDYKIDSFNSYSKPEITMAKPLKQVTVKMYHYTKGDAGVDSTVTDTNVIPSNTNAKGETVVIDNPLIDDGYRAAAVGVWIGTHLGHRMTLDSSWRSDVRLDALDIVTNENRYNSNKVRMTDVTFKFNGAFRGTSKGKVI
jgi:hypothetical protein